MCLRHRAIFCILASADFDFGSSRRVWAWHALPWGGVRSVALAGPVMVIDYLIPSHDPGLLFRNSEKVQDQGLRISSPESGERRVLIV